MIQFFRKVRKEALPKTKFGSYLLYAIGEIILVVIGILVALQISNWNEGLKAKKFEKEILVLIEQNLQKDSIAMAMELFEAKRAIELTNRLLKQVESKNYNDSLNIWMGKIISFERFKSQSSAFEVLKSKGIEAISNKELQLALISYYDESLFQVYQSLEDVEQSFNADWIPVLKQDFADFVWLNYSQPINPKVFFEKPSTILLFKLYQDNRSGTVKQIEAALKKITEIRKLTKSHTL